MKNVLQVLIFIIFFATANAVNAKEVIGHSFIGSDEIVIYKDGTWKYESDREGNDCDLLGGTLYFCGNESRFGYTPEFNPDAVQQYQVSDREYAMVIAEEIGSSDGMSQEYMTKTVVSNAATGLETSESEMRRFAIEDAAVAGRKASTVTYGANMDGLDVVFMNTILILPHTTFQLITFRIEKSPSDVHVALHDEFLALVKDR